VIQALLASNILCLFISTEVNGGTEFLHTHHSSSIWTISSSEHCRRAIFSNLQRSEPKNNKNNNIPHLKRSIPSGVPVGPQMCFKFLRFFERTLYKSNYIIFILSWWGTHTKIRSKLVDIVTAGPQKITLWGPQGNPPPFWYIKG